MNEKILVVDDEKNIVDFISLNLKKNGFAVVTAYDGTTALQKAMEESPDLILLDLMLPDIDGFEVCRRIREKAGVPIIILTARDEDMDKIVGLETGADDYVVKPFNPKELIARINAILRRTRGTHTLEEGQKIRFKNMTLDIFHRKLWIDEKMVDLAPREFDLLLMLASNRGQTFSREEILMKVWGYEFVDQRSVDVHIKFIREKLGKPLSECIQTVWGKGYLFADTADD